MSQEGKFLLESILGKLLGFDEGAGDLLNHLLTIESEEDLKEYLSQLLGSETPETEEFVANVGRYQRGEEVLYKLEKEGEEKEDEAAKVPSRQQGSSAAATKGTISNANKNKQNALQARKNQKQQGKKGKVPPPSKKAISASQSSSHGQSTAMATSAAAETTAQSAAASAPAAAPPVVIQKPKPPQRGKAEFICGCMGNRDKPLANCLYCGRIVCEREGYGYCPYCGFLIEEMTHVSGNNTKDDESWAQKERLLRFDRDFARRTKIFDDQADFQGPATWMSEEERGVAEQTQQDRLEALRRPKQVLNIGI
ncbi:MAG: hypothetical protein SGBAC_005463 [Bacillariaceae sp.]